MRIYVGSRGHRHWPWGFSIWRLHVVWYEAWEHRCTWHQLIQWHRP